MYKVYTFEGTQRIGGRLKWQFEANLFGRLFTQIRGFLLLSHIEFQLQLRAQTVRGNWLETESVELRSRVQISPNKFAFVKVVIRVKVIRLVIQNN